MLHVKPPPPLLNVIYKISYYNKICVRSKLKNRVTRYYITLLAAASSPQIPIPNRLRPDHNLLLGLIRPTVTPFVHTEQVRSGGNTYDWRSSNSRREINWQFMAFLSLFEQIQYPTTATSLHTRSTSLFTDPSNLRNTVSVIGSVIKYTIH